jgi:hypothetical protein
MHEGFGTKLAATVRMNDRGSGISKRDSDVTRGDGQ